MGNSGGKNRTHPREEEDFGSSPALVEGRHGYNYDYDQHRDYDSGVRMNKIPSKYYSYIFFIIQWHQNKTYGESYQYDDNNPIVKKRSCTDVLCILLFVAFLGGWGVVAFFGMKDGDITKVIYPTNSKVRSDRRCPAHTCDVVGRGLWAGRHGGQEALDDIRPHSVSQRRRHGYRVSDSTGLCRQMSRRNFLSPRTTATG